MYLQYLIVYPESRYTLMINNTADRIEVFKLHLNNIGNRNRFHGNENQIFGRKYDHTRAPH